MSGGTWTLQDKIRPGAYVNFTTDSSWNRASAGAGVVTLALELNWGPEQEIVEIYAADILNGRAEALTGYPAGHSDILAVEEALANCNKLLLYRVNSGGDKASAQLDAQVATAKYPGTRGNDISVSVAAVDESFVVTTYVGGREMERQIVTGAAPQSNAWVDFTLTDPEARLTPVAATSLTEGHNGAATASDYLAYFSALKNRDWQVMALPSDNELLPPLLTDYIKDLRENLGKKVQGVVYDYPADYEGIITVDQGYVKNGVRVEPPIFVAWVAGATAGAEIFVSNTYKVINNASEIINELSPEAIDAKLNKGYFVVARRTDGTIIVEQDINSLTSGAADKGQVFKKNRVIRTLDKIANGITNMFEMNYIGSINNNAEGRDLFKQDIIAFINEMAAVGAVEDFAGADDIKVEEGKNPDSIVVNLAICPVDAMEKLYITVEVIS